MARATRASLLALIASATCINGLELDLNSISSIDNSASAVAQSLISTYNNAQSSMPSREIGTFGSPYYWWESGAVWGGLISYWAYTNDSTFNPTITEALQAQVGQSDNYMPANQTKDEANDDQATWALACMDAVELGFPAAPSGKPQWLQLAENVWNTQAARWDNNTCNGGLRWQIFAFNAGYDYKATYSNALFFQLSARLARYTGNQTYSEWADKSWAWLSDVGLIDSSSYLVFDGTDAVMNCTQLNHVAWSYNVGALLYGAAVLYNSSNSSSTWRDRIEGLTTASIKYFSEDGIIIEQACETQGNCNTDQKAFKGIFAGWIARSVLVAPFLRDETYGLISSSAKAAAAACTNGTDSSLSCDFVWTTSNKTGTANNGMEVSEKLSALDIIQAVLAYNTSITIRRQSDAASSSSNSSGGASNSNSSSGGTSSNSSNGGSSSQGGNNGTSGGTGAANSIVAGGSLMHVGTVLLLGLLAQFIL